MMQSLSTPNAAGTFLDIVWESIGTELALLALFCAGFVLFRIAGVQRFVFGNPRLNPKGFKSFDAGSSSATRMMPAKQLEANWAAGSSDLVLSAWPSIEHFTVNALKAVVEALVATGRAREISSAIQQILNKDPNMCSRQTMHAVLQVLPADVPALAGPVRAVFSKGFAKASKNALTPQAAPCSMSPEEHAHVMRIVAAVQSRQMEEAQKEIVLMHGAGYKIPPSCFGALARSATGQTLLKDLPSNLFCAESFVALFDYAAKSGDSKFLRDTHQRADELELLLTPAVSLALLQSYAAVGDSRAVEVFDELVSKGCKFSEGVLTSVISLCAESHHIQMAEHVLKHARDVTQTSLSVYAAMVKVYGQARLFDKTCSLYERMQADRVEPDTVVYGSLIKAAVESGRLELARTLFRESGNPDLLNYMSLIRAAGREKDLPKALELLEQLEEAPLVVDATAYNCVLEVCVTSGNRTAATKLLKRMEEKGQVDVVSYNTYLKLLFAEGLSVEIDNVLQTMRNRGLSPNAVTYNSLVKDAVMRQDLQRAWALIKQMEAEGPKPDAFTCSILMKGVKHTSCSEDVDKIVDLMQRAKVTPDEVLVNCLLDAYVRLRNIPRLVQVLEQFKSTGAVPSLHACALLIKAYGHARRLDCAWDLWNELIHERKLTPNGEVFASMVDACLAAGDLENAMSVFRKMKHNLTDFSRGPSIFANLVKACVARKQTKLALEIYEEMQEVSFTCSKITYNTILDALVRQGDVDKAATILRDMELKGVMPDLISYATLIKGHCTRGCLEQGLQLLGLMQRRGIAPDAIVFNSILDGCAHKQMRTLTEQVLKDMETAGIAPSNFTLSILVKLYGRCQDLDTAFQVVETYPAKYKFKLNAQVYTCLMSACIANGSLPRAMEVYKMTTEAGCPADGKMYQTLLNGCVRHGDLDMAERLMNDAIKQGPQCVEREAADNVLFMMARRGRGVDLGVPMLAKLDAAGIWVSDRVRSAVSKCDAPRAQNVRPRW
jgi:pentatricopeptide repeat protein